MRAHQSQDAPSHGGGSQGGGSKGGAGRRGRLASRPSDIPKAGWRDILSRLRASLSEDRVLLVAAGVTFYLILALFPALAAFVAVYGLFLDPATVTRHIAALEGVAPPALTDLISVQLQTLAAQQTGDLGFGAVIGLLVAFWSANGGVKAIIEGLNVAYDERETRSFLRLNLVALAFTLGAMMLILLMVAALAIVPALLAFLPLGSLGEIAISLSRWPLLLLAVGLALSMLYRWGPAREAPDWRWVTWGSAFGTLGWIATSVGFSLYLENFADFAASYGAFAAPIAVLLWLWISMIVILIGAEINGEIEHQTLRDSTTGTDRPIGARGAEMADTLGKRADRD